MSIHPHTPLVAARSEPAPAADLVPVRPRSDGWTPDRQREFLEHLADTGSVRAAAGLVGMTEQSAYRLRRRPDAEAFGEAWRAALQSGVDSLAGVALDRALHGAVRGRYFRGELVGEERVPSDRLLIWLMTRGRAAIARHDARRARQEAEAWERTLESVERPAPAGAPSGGYRVWRGPNGYPLTNLPPGPDFNPDDWQDGEPGDPDYERCLSAGEKEAWRAAEVARDDADERARIRFFDGLRDAAG